jgi:hypothetical protein
VFLAERGRGERPMGGTSAATKAGAIIVIMFAPGGAVALIVCARA